jgi:DNA polymerase-4
MALSAGLARTILHVDADAFFASVEQRDDPKLRRRPVAVGTGVVASCSYEARQHGVRTAMRLAEARRCCPELIVVPGHYPRYEQIARQLLALCRERTPQVEAAALDDLYLDLSGACPAWSERRSGELREQVRDELGISISAGSGSNKLVAQVATRRAKPGRHVGVPPGEERSFLAPWPVRVLPGAGSKVEAQLDRLNVRRVREVGVMPAGLLRQLFGVNGLRLHEYAHGLDFRLVVPERRPQRVSRRTSFDPPQGDPAFLLAMLDYLLERAATWLRYHDLAARGLTLTLRYGDFQSADGHERLNPPTQQDDLLREAAHSRWARLYTRRLPLRLIGVELTPLTPADRQGSLFADPGEERRQRLTACKDAVRRRFGFTSLLSGTALQLTDALPHDRNNLHLRTPCLTR